MPFPFSYSNSFDVNYDSSSELLLEVENSLRSKRPKNASLQVHDISFKGGIRSGMGWSGWNLLNTISSGEIRIIKNNNQAKLKYEIKFSQLFGIAVIINIMIPLIQNNFKMILLTSLMLWLVFYMGNCLIAIFRFNLMIKQIIVSHNRKIQESAISAEQKEWMDSDSMCPACGFRVTNIDMKCNDCGLSLK